MECVAYMRVSTEKQAEEGNGLDSQKRDIKAYCQKNDLLIADWYIDDGYTGANMERPALQRMISDCMAGKVKSVVAFKLDRLSRSMVDGIYIIERIFLPNEVKFYCVHDSISYDSPMEQAYTQMMAVFAQLDKNTMMLRMRGGMLERIKKGYWRGGGNLPYCYRYDRDDGILKIIPERAEQARCALDLYLDGYSDEYICHVLGFANESIVKNILTSSTNIGKQKYKGLEYEALHEPVFDKEKFYAAQRMRKRRSIKSMYKKREPNLLTGLCYCGVCGCAMRYQRWGKYHVIYCCSRSSHLSYLPNFDPNCNNTTCRADEVEESVSQEIKKISLNIDDIGKNKNQSVSEVLSDRLSAINRKLSRLYDLYADGNDVVVEKISQLEEEKKSIKADLEKEKGKESCKHDKKEIIKEIKKIADVWDTASNPTKNAMLKKIADKIVIFNGHIDLQLREF